MSAPLAIVTGGGKRVGAVLVERLLRDGWAVVAHVHEPGDPVPDGALPVAADLGKPDCGDRILRACPTPPRLLVNCAARFAPEAFAATAGASGDRLIVNILDAKLKAPNPDFLSYTLSKAALAALTEVSARALAGEGVRVNGIAPALMLRSPGQSRENFERMHAHNPLERGVDPDHVWRALRFLLDTPVVTGEVLTLDAGQRFMGLPRDVQFLDLPPPHGAPA